MNRKLFFEYALFVEAWICLSFAKLLVVFLPFKKIASMIGEPQVESPKEVKFAIKVKDIEISIIRAVKYALFASKCYDQALATTYMLKRRKITSTIYFGLHKKDDQLVAHAWVRCGENIISGRKGHEIFTTVAWFGSHNLG